MVPPPSARLRFRAITDDDLYEMAALLGDPAVMAHYPAPKTRQRPRLGSTGTSGTTPSSAPGCG